MIIVIIKPVNILCSFQVFKTLNAHVCVSRCLTVATEEVRRNRCPLSVSVYLLQEGCQVAGAPLVRFGQVYVLQVKHQVLAVLGPEDPAGVGAEQHAGLAQLLQDVAGGSLGTAVDHSHLGGAQPREGKAEEHSRRRPEAFRGMLSSQSFKRLN